MVRSKDMRPKAVHEKRRVRAAAAAETRKGLKGHLLNQQSTAQGQVCNSQDTTSTTVTEMDWYEWTPAQVGTPKGITALSKSEREKRCGVEVKYFTWKVSKKGHFMRGRELTNQGNEKAEDKSDALKKERERKENRMMRRKELGRNTAPLSRPKLRSRAQEKRQICL